MTSVFPLDTYRNDLASIVAVVFETMMRLEPKPVPGTWSPEEEGLTAAVRFAGDWSGAVLLECTTQQAYTLTQLLTPGAAEAPTGDDVRGALGEIANVLAGNLKPLLPKGVHLSVPEVAAGVAPWAGICTRNPKEQLCFECRLGRFAVTLVEIIDAEDR